PGDGARHADVLAAAGPVGAPAGAAGRRGARPGPGRARRAAAAAAGLARGGHRMSEGKRAAGYAAAELVEDGMRLGLGTGSTVAFFLERLAARGLDVAGVPTSRATEQACHEHGIRLLDPSQVARLDLCVD